MKQSVLVTGGAGFIGSFLVDQLVEEGYPVRILDNLDPQVHPGSIPPKYLNKEAEFIEGNVLDENIFKRALSGIETVFHFASCVGVGQSQYEIAKYTSVNCGGTALLWDIIVKNKLKIKKVFVPSSMTCFGEGLSRCDSCGIVKPLIRKENEISTTDYRCRCPWCRSPVSPVPTPSDCRMMPGSVYALSKKFQEELTLVMGKTYNIPVVIFRYFNVYGPRQSLSNPYTGVTAIFLSRIKNNNNPIVYEDGLQTRDFISVHDVVDLNIKAMDDNRMSSCVQNVGSGIPMPIKEVGERLIRLLNADVKVDVTRNFRKGDIRHCYVDINELKTNLSFTPQVDFDNGIMELASWSEKENAVDQFDKATRELSDKRVL